MIIDFYNPKFFYIKCLKIKKYITSSLVKNSYVLHKKQFYKFMILTATHNLLKLLLII